MCRDFLEEKSNIIILGMAVHNDARAGAAVAPAHGAEVMSLGRLGTRQGALDSLLRTLPSQAQPLIVVSAAGLWGDWRSR